MPVKQQRRTSVAESTIKASKEKPLTAYEHYQNNMITLPIGFISPASVLLAIVESVIDVNCIDNIQQKAKQRIPAKIESIITPDGQNFDLVSSASSGTFESLLRFVKRFNNIENYYSNYISTNEEISQLNYNYVAMQQKPKISKDKALLKTVIDSNAIVEFELQAKIRLHIQRIMALKEFKSKPIMSTIERGIKESELLTFTPLTPIEFYRNHQLELLAEMIYQQTKVLPNFTGALDSSSTPGSANDNDTNSELITSRQYYRNMNSMHFLHTLSAELLTEPMILSNYYEMTDQVLLALHWPPPERRNKVNRWNYELKAQGTNTTHNIYNNGDKANKNMDKVSWETRVLTPAGKALIFFHQLSSGSTDNANNTWLTATLDNNETMLGMRILKNKPIVPTKASSPRRKSRDNANTNAVTANTASSGKEAMFFFIDSDYTRTLVFPGPLTLDEQQQNKKPDKHGTACLLTVFPNNMQVSTCSNGNIKISSDYRFIESDPSVPTQVKSQILLFGETSRLIGKGGSVSRNFSQRSTVPFSKEILTHDGCRILFVDKQKYLAVKQTKNYPYSFEVDILCNHLANKAPIVNNSSNGPTANTDIAALNGDSLTEGSVAGEDSATVASSSPDELDFDVIYLDNLGNISYLLYNSNTIDNNEFVFVRRCTLFDNIRTTIIDAESKALIYYFQDKRVIIHHYESIHAADHIQKNEEYFYQQSIHHNHNMNKTEQKETLCEVFFSDGTHMLHDLEENMLTIQRCAYTDFTKYKKYVAHKSTNNNAQTSNHSLSSHSSSMTNNMHTTPASNNNDHEDIYTNVQSTGWPSVEIDLEVDSTCREHSKGKEVPINKGGNRVQSRVALPNGSAILIKYDTRVTATSNGSIKLVTRDRTCVTVADDGQVQYMPKTTWTAEAEKEFLKDSNNKAALENNALLEEATYLKQQNSQKELLQHITQNTSLHSTNKSPLRSTAAHNTSQTSKRSKSPTKKLPLPAATTSNNSGSSPAKVEEDAIFTIQLFEAKCTVKDNEFNFFHIDLTANSNATSTVKQNNLKNSNTEPSATTADATNESAATNSPLTVNTSTNSRSASTVSSVVVELAGEVSGLKPPAVAKNPKPARLFILNRDAEALEILSVEDVKLLDCIAKWNPDCYKHSVITALAPQTQYFVERVQLGCYNTGLPFAEVFGNRKCLSYKLPAAATQLFEDKLCIQYLNQFYSPFQAQATNIDVVTSSKNISNSLANSSSKIITMTTVYQIPPLPTDVFTQQVTKALQNLEAFRQERNVSIDRFAVIDNRTPEQIEEEEQMTKRLKQVYKAAKVQAAKKQQHKQLINMHPNKNDDMSEDNESHKSSSNTNAVANTSAKPAASGKIAGKKNSALANYQPHVTSTIVEGLHEDEDEEDNDNNNEEENSFGDDEDDNAEQNPEEMEIRRTFEDYAHEYNSNSSHYSNANNNQDDNQSQGNSSFKDNNHNNINNFIMPLAVLRDALIQVTNQYLSKGIIKRAIRRCGEVDSGLEDITIQEFRSVFFALKELLEESKKNGNVPDIADDEAMDEEKSYDDGDINDHDSDGDLQLTPANLLANTSSSTNKPAPLLNFTKLNEQSDNDSQGSNKFIAAGAGINVVRKAKGV